MAGSSASPNKQPWSFDVSSLMILINETEELNYRLSQRSLLECISAVPVVGLQNYIRSYDLLLEPGSLTYFSPYGCKSAPLRNMQLTNAIKHGKILEDKRYTVFSIPVKPQAQRAYPTPSGAKLHGLLVAWAITTWILFAGLILFSILVPETTWIGTANCAVYTGWSILLRVVEFSNIEPAPVERDHITGNDDADAVFIMGRNNSAFVLEGARKDIKDWTSRGLLYKARPLGISSEVWQGFTRLASLCVLLFIFSTIPNGSTMDQVAFIILNLLAQLNVIIGQRLSSGCCLAQLEKLIDKEEGTRTHIYGELIRRFKHVEESKKWVEISGLIPKTDVWDEWKARIILKVNDAQDSKGLYKEIADAKRIPSVSK